jgi:hypothetical protein
MVSEGLFGTLRGGDVASSQTSRELGPAPPRILVDNHSLRGKHEKVLMIDVMYQVGGRMLHLSLRIQGFGYLTVL